MKNKSNKIKPIYIIGAVLLAAVLIGAFVYMNNPVEPIEPDHKFNTGDLVLFRTDTVLITGNPFYDEHDAYKYPVRYTAYPAPGPVSAVTVSVMDDEGTLLSAGKN